jgi:hypothetical protein
MRALPFVVLVACAPRAPTPHARAHPEAADGGRPPLATVGSEPHPCAHDEKDAVGCILDCDRGIAFACIELATRFERGAEVPRDLARAASLNERACDLREPSGCTAAARMFAAGIGVPPSRARQLDYLERACGLGDAIACNVPARAFATGNGVPRDERRAKALLERACLGGVETACESLGDAGY